MPCLPDSTDAVNEEIQIPFSCWTLAELASLTSLMSEVLQWDAKSSPTEESRLLPCPPQLSTAVPTAKRVAWTRGIPARVTTALDNVILGTSGHACICIFALMVASPRIQTLMQRLYCFSTPMLPCSFI
eukprot:103892-Amphidinium_carterae.1